MRRYLSQSAGRASLRLREASPRAPFICAECQKHTATRRGPSSPTTARRTITSTAHLQHPTTSPTPQAAAPPEHHSSPPQSHYDFFPETFPSGPPPNSPFTPDLKLLRKEFLQLQAKVHPDFAPPHQKRQAEALSSRINEAYRTLQDPLRRAQYLLSLRGVDVENDAAKLSESALLMEVMEAREAVEEVEDEEGLVRLREENDERVAESVRELEEAFAKEDLKRAEYEAVRLRYWRNIEESIVGWEKGKGGGILHH